MMYNSRNTWDRTEQGKGRQVQHACITQIYLTLPNSVRPPSLLWSAGGGVEDEDSLWSWVTEQSALPIATDT
jgi:hypothetical protein